MKTSVNPKDRFVIIMAGGRGERFWPVSRQATPKQLLTLLGKRSFLQQAVDRVLPLVPAYLGQLTAIAVAANADGLPPSRWTAMRHALAYVAGFGAVFTLLPDLTVRANSFRPWRG